MVLMEIPLQPWEAAPRIKHAHHHDTASKLSTFAYTLRDDA